MKQISTALCLMILFLADHAMGVEFLLEARVDTSKGEKTFERRVNLKNSKGEFPKVAKHLACAYFLEKQNLTVICKKLPSKDTGGSSQFSCPKDHKGTLGTSAVFGDNEIWRFQVSCTQ